MARSQPLVIIMRKKFCLIGCHVYLQRTVPLAAFARQTEIKSFPHKIVAPAVLERIAVEHFKEQMRAAPGRMHLFPRDTIARTHRAYSLAPAFPNADATLGRAREASPIVTGKSQMGLKFRWTIVDS